jgi:hypothetical protein
MLPPNKSIAITLTAQEWSVVLGALHEAPYRVAAPVLQKIVEQANSSGRDAERELPYDVPELLQRNMNGACA